LSGSNAALCCCSVFSQEQVSTTTDVDPLFPGLFSLSCFMVLVNASPHIRLGPSQQAPGTSW
ncbi:hypothetical protein EMPG_17785, partial [Blastomyces silverae]